MLHTEHTTEFEKMQLSAKISNYYSQETIKINKKAFIQ